MKRVIVTGASGFVGANLARRLVRDGHDCHLLVRPGSDTWRIEEFRDDAQVHALDLEDADELERTVASVRPDWIFHLAAHGAYSWQTDARRMVRVNLIGTMNLVAAALKSSFESFVTTGSSSEYGVTAHAPTEADALDPNSAYAVTKAAATMFCRHTARQHRVHLPTLRLYSVYGPYEEPNRFIATLIVRGLEGKLPPLTNADTARDFVFVDDVIEAYLLAATRPSVEHGAVYNVGTGVQSRLRDVVELSRTVLPVAAEPEWCSMPDRAWDTAVWIADNRKICADLGWHPRHKLEDGFRRTVYWFRAYPALFDRYRHCICE